MVWHGIVDSMWHIYGTSIDNTGQQIFLKTDVRNQGHSGRLIVYVQPPWPKDVFTNQQNSYGIPMSNNIVFMLVTRFF